MDSFSPHSSMGSVSPQISTEDLKDQLKNQLAQAYAQEFLEVYLFFMNLSLSLFLCASTIDDDFLACYVVFFFLCNLWWFSREICLPLGGFGIKDG
ncbi:hypothetical protein D5086_022024 [Populus alba]|uniref:Uncharacterized protein n=1 Tax=Populus alba TaxID=43335 RepID=A0ACC4BES4_POPAL